MTSLPPPAVNEFPADSLERQVYNIVDKFIDNIPVTNDRYRLGFGLVKYLTGEGDAPEILVKSTKIKIAGITASELAKKLSEEINAIKK
ncbi:MAG: hypothetical protein V1720_07770 [bacterium]